MLNHCLVFRLELFWIIVLLVSKGKLYIFKMRSHPLTAQQHAARSSANKAWMHKQIAMVVKTSEWSKKKSSLLASRLYLLDRKIVHKRMSPLRKEGRQKLDFFIRLPITFVRARAFKICPTKSSLRIIEFLLSHYSNKALYKTKSISIVNTCFAYSRYWVKICFPLHRLAVKMLICQI